MNEPAENFGAPASEVEDLREEVQSLRVLLAAALCILIVLSVCVDGYLFKQVSMVRSDVNMAQDVVKRFDLAKAREFWAKLTEYSRSHPDFAPVVAKYKPYAAQTVFEGGGPLPK
jgi:hypothetical protein